MKKYLFLTILFAWIFGVSCATEQRTVQTAETYKPGEQEIEKLLQIGKWKGTWYDKKYQGSLDATLEIIKKEQEIEVIYSWGDSPSWKIEKGNSLKQAAFYWDDKGKLVLYFGKSRGGNNFEFVLDENNDWVGRIVNSTNYITMHPVRQR